MSDSFSRRRAHMIQLKARREGVETDVPRRHAAKAAFSKCPHCGAGVSKRELARTLYVCPQCGYHHPIGAYLRLSMLLDSKSFCELEERLAGTEFVRASKQMLVNFDHVASIRPALNARLQLMLDNGEAAIVSRQYAPAVKRKLGL